MQTKGHQFTTHSDTETILYAWVEWGERCVEHLRGMFAFAIWDQSKHTLFCARDRLGVKPFLYSLTDDGFFLFASEHKALLEHPSIKKDINFNSIETYFALGYIADPESIFQSIRKLPPGHTLTLRKNQNPQLKQYWDLPFGSYELAENDAQEELFERLKEAIGIRLISEVPLGAFLSGGVDSSSVVAIMSQIQDEPIKTCSIGFDNALFDEAEFAREVAQHCHTDHFQKIVNSNDYTLIDKLVEVYDEPFD